MVGSKQHEGLERRSYELSVLHDVAQALNASLDLASLSEQVLEKVAELLGLETGWVLLLDESSGEPYAAATQNLPPGLCDAPERMRGWCFCMRSFTQGKMPEAANVGLVQCSRLRQLRMANGDTAGLRFHASIPLKVFDSDASGSAEGDGIKHLGMLNVASMEWREITDDELQILETIGGLLGVAIERADLHARMLEAAQSEERLRMAREIHDTIAQDFSAIAFQLDTAQLLLEPEGVPEEIMDRINTARELASKGLTDARRSVFDLRAARLEGRSLPEALVSLVQEMNAKSEASVRFEPSATAGLLAPAVEVGLYRIGQEALQNALSHSDAGHITVRLERDVQMLRLHIEDDGRGFDVEEIVGHESTAGRFGLIGMRERARLLGGTLHVESTPGLGTRITAEVPAAAAPE